MKNLKTALIIIGVLLILSVLAFFLPFDEIANRIPYISDLYRNTSLSITSAKGKADVQINGESYGETPVSITDLSEGSYTVKLTRVSDSENFYSPQSFQVDLTKNTEAVINIELGPEDTKSGHILYYTKTPSTGNEGFLTFSTQPEESDIYLDGEFLTKSSLDSRRINANDYQVSVRAEGYEEITFPVIVREGYNLNIQTFLLPIPWEINQSDIADGE